MMTHKANNLTDILPTVFLDLFKNISYDDVVRIFKELDMSEYNPITNNPKTNLVENLIIDDCLEDKIKPTRVLKGLINGTRCAINKSGLSERFIDDCNNINRRQAIVNLRSNILKLERVIGYVYFKRLNGSEYLLKGKAFKRNVDTIICLRWNLPCNTLGRFKRLLTTVGKSE